MDESNTIFQYSRPLLRYLDAIDNETIIRVTLIGYSMGGLSISYAMEMYPHKVSNAIFFVCIYTSKQLEFFTSAHLDEDALKTANNNIVSFNYRKGESKQHTSMSINPQFVKPYLYNESPEEDVRLAQSLLTPTPFAVAFETLRLSN
eukprot:Gb_34178 [translate_table: standard]